MKFNFNLNFYGHIVWIERRHRYQSYSDWFRDVASHFCMLEGPEQGCPLVVYNQTVFGTKHNGYAAMLYQNTKNFRQCYAWDRSRDIK